MTPTENSIKPLTYYTAAALGCTQAEFEERYPGPALVLAPFREVSDEVRFETLQDSGSELSGLPLVAPIAKRSGANALGSMITLGRAGNNDVELRSQSVSKFQGHFTHGPDGGLVFVDAGSHGGTWIDGERLQPGGRCAVAPGTRLRLGRQEALLCDPALLYTSALGPPESLFPR